jgi:hypothetical protein
MIRTKQQIGTLISSDLYREVRALALMRGCNAGEIIDDALRRYLKAEWPKDKMRRTRWNSKP